MNLPNGTMLINPTLPGDNPTFSVCVVQDRTPEDASTLRCLRTFGTMGEALAYIEGCIEEQFRGTTHRDLTDHDIPAGS